MRDILHDGEFVSSSRTLDEAPVHPTKCLDASKLRERADQILVYRSISGAGHIRRKVHQTFGA